MKDRSWLGFGMGLVLGGILGTWLPDAQWPALHRATRSVSADLREATGFQEPVLVIDVRDSARAAAVRAAIDE